MPPSHPVTFSVAVLRFSNRIGVYVGADGRRVPLDHEQQAVRLDFAYPDAEQLQRGMPLVKWLLAILYIGVFFAVIGAWFAILFTGRCPRGIFKFVEGTIRWHNRVVGYAFSLITDQYPPFRLAP